MATKADFTFFRAEDIAIVFTQKQADGVTALDITGWTITFRVASSEFGAALFTKVPTLTTPLQGVFTVNIASADTSALTQEGSPTTYYYDVRRTDAGFRTELFYGNLTIKDTETNG
jgi:hypothetical protein